MIQRVQSVWLLLAALLNSGTLFFDLYRYHTLVNGADQLQAIRAAQHYPTILVASVIIILPLVTIFMYNNRKRQLAMAVAGITATAGFITLALGHITSVVSKMTPPPVSGSYWIGSVIPAAAVIMLVLAILGIKKDDKLVRSMDRLR
jgi:FtsH-binding integral membrane protein